MQSGTVGLQYRPDIDGLRAIAVLLVVAFHAAPTIVPGGYVGVDVFFVISGYLITGLLLHELRAKQFNFAQFYARRIRRLFPALIVVLAACLWAGWFLLLPDSLASLGANIAGGAAFSSNIVLFRQSGYFDLAAATKPLLHLWSLGVEEQFYIVWPALLLAFWRRGVLLIAGSILLASFAWNIAHAGTTADFYLPFGRAWELMIGGIIFTLTAGKSSARSDIAAAFGLGLLAIATALLSPISAFPGWWALLPVCGTALLLSTEGAWINRVALSHRAVVGIGLISYPLYLWHWPLLSFVTIAYPTHATPWLRAAAVALAFGLAFATYLWIERPIRKGYGAQVAKITGLCTCMAVIGALGVSGWVFSGFPQRIPMALRMGTTVPADRDKEWRLGTCLVDQTDNTGEEHFSPICAETKRPLIFHWGDSYSAALYPGLRRLQEKRGFGISQYSTAGCPPVLNFPVEHRPHCVEDDAFVFAQLREQRPDIVLLYSAWNYGDIYPKLKDIISKLRALKIPRIIVMGPPPDWAGGLPKAAFDYYKAHPIDRLIPRYSDFHLDHNWEAYQAAFSLQVRKMSVEYISTWDVLCKNGKCRTWVDKPGGDLTAFDYSHLTVAGSIFLANAIGPCLFRENDILPPYCFTGPSR